MRVEVCPVAHRGTYNFDDHGKFRWITQHGARPPPDRCARPIAEPGMTIEQNLAALAGKSHATLVASARYAVAPARPIATG
jgi:hypothetical protein